MTIDGDNQADAGQQVARAESLRAEGRLAEAKELLCNVLSAHPDHTLGRLVLALVHLDLGQQDQSRSVLEAALSTPSIPSEPELATAVEFAGDPLESVQAEMDSGTEAAQAATSSPELSAQFSADSPFANPTMAKLLEEQGHAKEAEALRNTMGDGEPAPVFVEDQVENQVEDQLEDDVLAGVVVDEVAGGMACEIGTEGESLAIIATLERWLDNVQRSAV